MARTLVHLLKYAGLQPAGAWMAERLAPLALPECDLVLAVPLGRKRGRQRGFNQSEAIARPLARMRGWRYEARALRRVRETKPQAGLSASERRDNVRGAFRAARRRVAERRLLLLDDVLTTGATVDACAAALKAAGAAAVHVATFARAERDAPAAEAPR